MLRRVETKRRAILSLLGGAASSAAILVACVPDRQEEAEGSHSALEQPDEVTIRIAQCALTEPLSDLALGVPIPENGHPLPSPTESQVLTSVELDAVVVLGGDQPGIRSYSATIARGDQRGTLAFNAGTSLFKQKVDHTQQRAWESILSTPGTNPSTLTIGDESTTVHAVALWWEKTGTWLTILKSEEGAGLSVVASAPACTFETKAWTVLAHPECYAALYGDAGVSNADPVCAHTPADTFAELDGSSSGSSGTSGTSGASGSSGTSGASGSSGTSGASGSNGPSGSPGASGSIGSGVGSSSGTSGGVLFGNLEDAVKDAMKKKNEQQLGCAVSATPGRGASDGAWLIAPALAVLARRRRRR